ncbi:MAG: ABC transporter substrate-binding protein, partial [Alphaproteobacteria bacterium]|nr:ABC transporter substrate-binding protein [Alphaproteobacteria bacterium]
MLARLRFRPSSRRFLQVLAVAALGLAAAAPAWSQTKIDIAVGNYGVSANGMPFGVALAKGYFKEEGLDVT